jgi:hypothetical protein
MGQAGKKKKAAQAAQTGETKLKVKLSYRDKAVQDVLGTGKRLVRLMKKLAKLPPELTLAVGQHDGHVESGVKVMVLALDYLAEQVAALPDEWKPGRAKRGSSLVVNIGDIVRISAKSTKRYEDVFPAGTDLQVLDVRTALIGVGTPGGATVYVPRGHLEAKGSDSEA